MILLRLYYRRLLAGGDNYKLTAPRGAVKVFDEGWFGAQRGTSEAPPMRVKEKVSPGV